MSRDLQQQREQRRAFAAERGYSTAAHYATGGLRELVLARDGYACVKCGMTDAEHKIRWARPITVDHIDKNRKRNVMDNLQTLCLSCHGRKDLKPELRAPRVPAFKAEILAKRAAGEPYQAIADCYGFSIAAIWKWVQRWYWQAEAKRCIDAGQVASQAPLPGTQARGRP